MSTNTTVKIEAETTATKKPEAGAILASVLVPFKLNVPAVYSEGAEKQDDSTLLYHKHKLEGTVTMEQVQLARGRGKDDAGSYWRPADIITFNHLEALVGERYRFECETAAVQELFKVWSRKGPKDEAAPDAAEVVKRMTNSILGKRDKSKSALTLLAEEIAELRKSLLDLKAAAAKDPSKRPEYKAGVATYQAKLAEQQRLQLEAIDIDLADGDDDGDNETDTQ